MMRLHFVMVTLVGFGMSALAAVDPATAGEHLLLKLLADRTGDIADPPQGKVAMRLSVTYHSDPLPGGGIEFYEPSVEADSLWAMESLPKGEAVPVGQRIKDNVVFLNPGEARMVTVVFRNPTASDVGFMVMPHRESPAGLAPDTWLTCLCMAFLYQAPAEGAWYRVMRVKVGPNMPPGSKVDVLWTILTDPAAFPEKG